jgi:outer membrane murein-binding lipoprotein Lpp
MQTRRDVLAAVTFLTGLALVAGCDSVPKPASTATLFNKEEVHTAIGELDSQIGSLEEDADAFDSENWRDVVPRIKEGAESVRGALDNLKKALGYTS